MNTPAKTLGIWMDYSRANLIEYAGATDIPRTIESRFTPTEKQRTLVDSEYTMHNKEQQLQTEYFRRIADTVLEFDHVLIFGPTDAKLRLHKLIAEDKRFNGIRITLEDADKMTENQQHAYVRNFFQQ